MFPLHLHALLDPALGLPERLLLQLVHQLAVELRLLDGHHIQVAHAVHVVLGGGHVQRRVVVVVQAPDVGAVRHQEEEAVAVSVGGCQVERRVPPYVTLVGVASVWQRRQIEFRESESRLQRAQCQCLNVNHITLNRSLFLVAVDTWWHSLVHPLFNFRVIWITNGWKRGSLS